MEITIVTFNYGNAGRYVNGPGMCLFSFVNQLINKGIKVNLFSKLKSEYPYVKPLRYNDIELQRAIRRSSIFHHWSGMGPEFESANRIACTTSNPVKIIIGPNVLDTVEFDRESSFLKKVKFNHILTVNDHLKFKIAKEHNIDLELIDIMMIGPDTEVWSPISLDNGKILWKGNSSQPVKNISFGLELSKALPQYEFEFIGYPNPYNYREHINLAKSCHLYISTSLSETMGLALAEQWCSGIPSVTHPKIYLHGENYKTGIITNYDTSSYCKAITEIMEDSNMHKSLSTGAINFVEKNFSKSVSNYIKAYTA